MRRSLVPALLPVILIAVLHSTCRGPQPTPEETTLTEVGQAAPTFQATTLQGEQFDLANQRGKVVLLNFFATWCGPCREELPRLEQEVWARFNGRQFAMLSLGREHTAEELELFAEKYQMSFPVAADPERAVYSLYATQYIPRNVLIGADGTIIYQSNGFEREGLAQMVETIEQALALAAEGDSASPEEGTAAAA